MEGCLCYVYFSFFYKIIFRSEIRIRHSRYLYPEITIGNLFDNDVISEFDPYFNYRTTKFLAEEGYYKFHNWFDDRAWYPLGRIIGGTIYPGKNSPY